MCFAPPRCALFRHRNFQKRSDTEVLLTFWLRNALRATRHALFRHRNFQKWSENGAFCTFWLRNALRAATACTFSTSQLPKVLRDRGVLYLFTSKSASRHNGVQLFISHLRRCLRTRRFSEPTSRPSGAKTQCFATFLPFRTPASSFFWSFLFWLFSPLTLLPSGSSHLCFFICPYCRKFNF